MSDFIEIKTFIVNKKCIEYVEQRDTIICIKFINNVTIEELEFGTFDNAKKAFENIKFNINPPSCFK